MGILESKEELVTAQEGRVLLGITPNTFSRYIGHGILGRDKEIHVLESLKIRGRIYTSRPAIDRFIVAISKLPEFQESRVAKKRVPSHAEATQYLAGGAA